MDDSFVPKHIVVTGGQGFLGRAVTRQIRNTFSGCSIRSLSRADGDLRNPDAAQAVLRGADVCIHLAADVGGIGYNRRHQASLHVDNSLIGLNVLEACRRHSIHRTVIIGTVCSYPKITKIPFREDDLFSGYPEESNAGYGIAKRILLAQAEFYAKTCGLSIACLLPSNLYGPGDSLDPKTSHVIPALIRKILRAKSSQRDHIRVWGTGEASRDFLFIDDAAEAICTAITKPLPPYLPINLGTGKETTIRKLVDELINCTGYHGTAIYDATYPDGQPRRCVSIDRAQEYLGFSAKTPLQIGLAKTVAWYRDYLSSKNDEYIRIDE